MMCAPLGRRVIWVRGAEEGARFPGATARPGSGCDSGVCMSLERAPGSHDRKGSPEPCGREEGGANPWVRWLPTPW